MKKYLIIWILFSIMAAVCCKPTRQATTDFVYFEKNLDTLNTLIKTLEEPVIKKNDILSIQVSSGSLNQAQTEVFNLMNAAGGAQAGGIMGYLVDYDGTITLPIIGRITAEGLTKNALTDTLVRVLEPHVMNPVVNVRFMNYRVLLMGEVRGVGWQNFPNERATVVDAIGQAGGMSDLGSRENVLIIREEPGGKRRYHTLNLNDARVFADPFYQLKQNDIVYVLPNETRLINYQRQNSPFFRDLPIYMTLVTSLLAFGTLIVALFK
ncbi:MAG TPA: polysaccharide biosynthesis/export family protein [Phnomibacter sp.]|nr:polysaccharide biosynthesis/export family protein [Phnomibacter sp.]